MNPVITNLKKRNNQIVPFEILKIENAVKKAFIKITRDEHANVAKHISELVAKELELEAMTREEYVPTVEHVQDLVEKHIMSSGFFDVAKEYIIYRFEHQKIREDKKIEDLEKLEESKLKVTKKNGSEQGFSESKIRTSLAYALVGYEKEVDLEKIVSQVKLEVHDGITTKDLGRLLIMIVRSMIELDPAYGYVAARLLMRDVYAENINEPVKSWVNINGELKEAFKRNIKFGIDKG